MREKQGATISFGFGALLGILIFRAGIIGTVILSVIGILLPFVTSKVDLKHDKRVEFYSYMLGFISGFFIWHSDLGVFLVFLSIFHLLEFLFTFKDLTVNSFLLNHSKEFNLFIFMTIVEKIYSPVNSLFSWWRYVGLSLAVLGQVCRSLAMFTAGRHFNHLVQTEKDDDHVLVTWGIYRFLRHPSYTGFCYWIIGLQLFLGNAFCLVFAIIALRRFFIPRIECEEYYLVSFFGQQYIDYRKNTFVLVPFL
jgi:protein-S-isoprenylcysteine O-methyltransferase